MILQDGFLMHDSLTFYAKAMSNSTNIINNFCYIWRKIWMNTDTRRKLHGSVPMSDGEIEALMERIGSDNLRVAYGEMLDGCKRDPERGIWFLSSHPC